MLEPKRTPLYEAHQALSARIIDFGGWAMPVQYPTGILEEHRTVRERVGLFDVSHMGEVEFRGAAAPAAVQHLVAGNIAKLGDGQALYTVSCLPEGGIVDDLIVYRLAADHLLIVVNAANIEKDFAWFCENTGDRAQVTNCSEAYALLAVQGPKAIQTLEPMWKGPPLSDVQPFRAVWGEAAGKRTLASRTGYTGEDGFELMVGATDARPLWDALLAAGAAPCGLGARDTLRLEARLCLYGNDITETTTPLEAGLGWVVKLDGDDFIGKSALVEQKAAGVRRKLAGFVMKERGIARHGYEIFDQEENRIGVVTSGGPSPTTGQNIALGYIPAELAEPGQAVRIDCRGKLLRAEVVKGPFYKRGTKT